MTTNDQHAEQLDWMLELYPQGDVYDALRAGAAALRAVEGAKAALETLRDNLGKESDRKTWADQLEARWQRKSLMSP